MEITRLRDRCRDLEERNRKLMADRDGEVRVLKRLLLTKGVYVDNCGTVFERGIIHGTVIGQSTTALYTRLTSKPGSRAYDAIVALWGEL